MLMVLLIYGHIAQPFAFPQKKTVFIKHKKSCVECLYIDKWTKGHFYMLYKIPSNFHLSFCFHHIGL